MLGAMSSLDAVADLVAGKTVLITGGTGSFGRACTRRLLDLDPKAVRIFSRDEFKQLSMRVDFQDQRMRFLIGDVRDVERLRVAFRGVDIVIHAAALKQVPACEYNPFEAVRTNILGASNVVMAAIDVGVPLTVALSTDKAVNPSNLYGATKLCAEKVFTNAHSYVADTGGTFTCVRYGNVVGSRGSVVPLFLEQARKGVVTITDERMTRFWITLDEAVEFVLSRAAVTEGGEVFVPKLPSMRIVDVAAAVAPHAKRKIIGIRAGEKLHEVLLTRDEARQAVDLGDCYSLLPFDVDVPDERVRVPEGFEYSSDANDVWLDERSFVNRLDSALRPGGPIVR